MLGSVQGDISKWVLIKEETTVGEILLQVFRQPV